ncbi:MAG: outer membrane beta-barrel protein [Verrucomicrobia bacterium]|nr:outer membrane beta-barrel protein [Verrucomicrobiota bacterium]
MNTRKNLAAALALASSLSAYADIKVNDNLMINGYVAGAYEYQKIKSTPSTDSVFDGTKDTPSADAVKTAFNFSFKPVTAQVSLYYVPNLPKNELSILDAFATYDVGGGFSITGGKFLSYLGYEAFDTVNMAQITYSPVTVGTLGAIPAYHTGLRLDYGDKDVSYGLAVVDSVFSPNGFSKGDGELVHNAGFEAFVKYTAVTDLTLWAGLAYDTKGSFATQTESVTVLDLWAEYKLTKELTGALEFCAKDGGDFAKGSTWLAYLNYAFDAKFSTVFRVGGESLSGKTAGNNFTQYTVGPSYKVSDNLTVRAEYSYYDYSGTAAKDKNLLGLQAVFKF